jgi:glycosyltransferase involved in cell wall biosynthesis
VLSTTDLKSEPLQFQIVETVQLELERYEEKPLFSLIIPIYDEADIITESLNVLQRFFEKCDCELVFFDDYSRDGTYDKLRKAIASSKNPKIRLMHSGARIGKGGTIKSAIAKAKGEVVLIMDADLSADLRSVPELVREARESEGLVVGERSISDRSTQGFLRVMLSLVYNILVRTLFRTGFRDHQCGFKAMKTDVARRLMAGIRIDGFVFDTELVVLAQRLGIPVRRVLVRWVDNRPSRSQLKWIGVSFTMMKDLFMLRVSHQ